MHTHETMFSSKRGWRGKTDTKTWGVHSTDGRQQPFVMEQCLADRGDGDEQIDTKIGGGAVDGQPTTALPIMPLVYAEKF